MTNSISHLSISFRAYKFYHFSFFITTYGAFNVTDPSRMQDTCHNKPSKYNLAHHKSARSSVVRNCPTIVWGVIHRGFDSHWRLRFFLCPTLMNIPSFYFFLSLKFSLLSSFLCYYTWWNMNQQQTQLIYDTEIGIQTKAMLVESVFSYKCVIAENHISFPLCH